MFGRSREVFVFDQTKGTFLASRVAVADSILGRLIGLLGRKSLRIAESGSCPPIRSIRSVCCCLSTWSWPRKTSGGERDLDGKAISFILPKRHAESVIELPLYTIFRSRTQVGDYLMIERYEAKEIRNRQPQPEREPLPLLADRRQCAHNQIESKWPSRDKKVVALLTIALAILHSWSVWWWVKLLRLDLRRYVCERLNPSGL